MKLFLKKTISTLIIAIAIPTQAFATSLPENIFGGGTRDIHIANNRVSAESIHVANNGSNDSISHSNLNNTFIPSTSPYNNGDRIGTLHVERLNRTIAVFEGESMANMNLGAGRFTNTGLHNGNIALIGHNRGNSNGFFDFVRLLREGDIIILEISGITRTFAVAFEHIVHETNLEPLSHFGDERLSLVTCVEYRPRYRRIAVAFEI